MQLLKSFRSPLFAIGEWLFVLPATTILAVAALRLLQPPQYQPAQTSWVIFEWTTTHISHLGAAVLFLGMPALVAVAGWIALLRMWRADQGLRQDVDLGLAVIRRNLSTILLALATVLGATILVLAVAHVVTD